MRILVIEDEKEIADGICAVLQKEGYQTDAVYDGLTGLDYMLGDIYDLVLLDVMLPKLGGLDLLKNARKEGVTAPVILLTAKSQVDDIVSGLDSGADDYMTKPFDAAELLARIRVRVRKPGEAAPGILSVGDIRLEQATYKLYGESRSVKLGNKEYHLLEYLMINAGQILPKDMILTKVWGVDDEGDYNNLEVYVSFLRKKLRFVGAKTNIRTTKGVGYALEEGN